MIEARGVYLIYPDGTVGLKDINLNINTGETVYVTGPSGSGKTSFLKLLMGSEYPSEGTLNVMGYSITKGSDMRIRQLRQLIGPVFQEFRLIKGRTVIENVMLGMRFLAIPKEHLKRRAADAIERVGLAHKQISLVDNLSWGECQRVAIARAVARKPLLILADEPTGNLDKDNAENILELLTSFKNENTTVIITTHATHLIENMKFDRHIRVQSGNISVEQLEDKGYEKYII